MKYWVSMRDYMKVHQIYTYALGLTMLAGLNISCTDDSYLNNAKKESVKYLNGNDLLKAERHAKRQKDSERPKSSTVNYWDSLLIEAKAQEAYVKGRQYVQDSVNGKIYRKEKYIPKLDTLIEYNFYNRLPEEYARYVSAEEFLKARENVPENNLFIYDSPYQVHYWNLITQAGRQREAYNRGAEDMRQKLLK